MGWFPFALSLSSRRPAQLTAPIGVKCPSTGSGRTAASWPGVSTLACPERLPWQAAEGLDTNGVSSLRAQLGNPGRQALAIVGGRSGLPRRCAPRNDGGGEQLFRQPFSQYSHGGFKCRLTILFLHLYAMAIEYRGYSILKPENS
jgi:hypothetical protein